MYRIGPNSKGDFRIISETAKASELEFTFENWQIQDRTYSITQRISIYSNTHFYVSKLTIKGMKGDEELISGIVDHGVGVSSFEVGDYQVLSTHGAQDIDGRALGMALATKLSDVAKISTADEYLGSIDQTHLLVMKGNEVSFCFFVGWELSDRGFKEESYFNDVVKEELKAIKN